MDEEELRSWEREVKIALGANACLVERVREKQAKTEMLSHFMSVVDPDGTGIADAWHRYKEENGIG